MEQKRDGLKLRGHSGQRSDSVEMNNNNINNDQIMQDRENLIKSNKSHIKKYQTIPPTTLEQYKFVKLIGKGAFGKVTLGIHKLTGK